MPNHPIYGELNGRSRLRRGMFGKLIVQVMTVDGAWSDATPSQLRAIGFEASSSKARAEAANGERRPPLDWACDDLPCLVWP